MSQQTSSLDGDMTSQPKRTGTAKSSTRREPTRPIAVPASNGGLGALIDGHGRDIAGIALICVGVVGGLGVYADAAGPLGRALNWLFEATAGVLAFVAPVACLIAGLVLIRGARSVDSATPDAHEATRLGARQFFGVVVAMLAITALIHILSPQQSVSEKGISAFAESGGWLGAVLGVPLFELVGTAASAVVTLMLLALGVSLASGRPLREIGASAGSGAAVVARKSSAVVASLFRVGEHPSDAQGSASQPKTFFDQDVDGSHPAPTIKRQQRSPGTPTRVTAKASDRTKVIPEVAVPTVAEQLSINLEPRPVGAWTLPPLSLLSRSASQQVDTTEISARGQQLEAALAEHGVTTRLVGMVVGPTVTRYELELGVGVKVNQVVNLAKDIAYAMASADVRIIAPIPGKQAIGVEVPNKTRQIVALGDILCSTEAAAARSPLSVGVGRDIEGHALMVDLAKMPHLLIAGQTGAGKSSCINSLMTSILLRATPDEVRLILVDPKRVELTQYNRVPHLLTQVVTNPKKAANALAWAVAEMERRYELLEEIGARDIGGYNAKFDAGELVAPLGLEREYQRLPLILIVVDELADLMMVAARDVEESINRIAAKARAVGIHLVIATQRPSVNVITGVIKANIPARFAFAVASATDSKVIMNTGGAERLVGQGDMLFLGPTSSSADRVQGCWVEEREVAAVVAAWRAQAPDVEFDDQVQGDANLAAVALPSTTGHSGGGGGADSDDDELVGQALELVVRSQLGSTSMLQRKLKVGFSRAGRLMDLLEERGVVGPSEGSKAREVLMTLEDFEAAQTAQYLGHADADSVVSESL